MVDLQVLRQAIRQMERHSALYRLLKHELTLQGHWRNRARGNPRKGYETSRFRGHESPDDR